MSWMQSLQKSWSSLKTRRQTHLGDESQRMGLKIRIVAWMTAQVAMCKCTVGLLNKTVQVMLE